MHVAISTTLTNTPHSAARTLAYRHGLREASLADIARQAQVPLGNVYYYFKTKEEIGEAIVEERLADMKSLQRKLEELDHPEDRFESVRSRAVALE